MWSADPDVAEIDTHHGFTSRTSVCFASVRRFGYVSRAMKKASEYSQHARECRSLAATMESEDQRDQLLRMAEHWEKLAADRAALISRHPDLAYDGEHDEERSC